MQCAWAGGAARHPVRVAACGWWRRMWERRGNRGSAWTAPAAARADRLRLRGRKSCALPIGVQRNMHMTQAGGRLGEGRQRRGGGLAAKSSHHGQHHTAAARHGFGQDEVVFGVVQIGFGEQKVQTDRARLARMDLRNHMGMQGTSPGPAADGGHAALIGDDQHHLRCGGGCCCMRSAISCNQRLARGSCWGPDSHHVRPSRHCQAQPFQRQGAFHACSALEKKSRLRLCINVFNMKRMQKS